MTTGVACATLPTSSSFCIIFFIRAYSAHVDGTENREENYEILVVERKACGLTTGNLVCLFLFFMVLWGQNKDQVRLRASILVLGNWKE